MEFDSKRLSFYKNYQISYSIEYLYGFSHEGFSYFITRQPSSLGSSIIETRLARVCQNDSTFDSYMEVTLECKDKKGTIYSFGTSFFIDGGEIKKQKLNNPF